MAVVDWYYRFRVLLLGECEVGKTSLVQRYTEGGFYEKQASTLGVDFYSKMVKVYPGVRRVKLQMWDTSGKQRLKMHHLPDKQERYTGITRTLFRKIVGVLLVFDLGNPDTFTSLHEWYMDAHYFLPEQAVFMLVGQKSDRESDKRVPTEEAAAWATSLGMAYTETSAKTNLNVDHVFQTMARTIYDAVTGVAVTIDAVNGDAVTGDIVDGDTVTGGVVNGDAVTGDAVTGDAVTGDAVTGDAVDHGQLARGHDWEDVKVVYRIRSNPNRRKKPGKMWCLFQ